MALETGTKKLEKLTWVANEVGLENFPTALRCIEGSSEGRINEVLQEVKERKEAKKSEAMQEKVTEFREIFGEEEERE